MGEYTNIICYLDILGFRKKILKYGIGEKINIYDNIISRFQKAVLRTVYMAWFSDTIILYTENLNRDKDVKIVRLIESAKALFREAIELRYPVRGSIEIGTFYHEKKKQAYLGKALIDAYEFANNHEWAGITCTSNVNRYIDSNQERLKNLVRKYAVPAKRGKVEEFNVINWCAGMSRDKVEGAFKIPDEDMEWDVQRKMNNTVKYFDDVTRDCSIGNV